jgi:uncharacterized protein YndB with AHSA1/START domain
VPRVRRRATVQASPEEVWRLLADPYHLPRWWPRCSRVEGVQEGGQSGRARWTMVLETARGSVVRADYRRRSAAQPSRLLWDQELEGTPFERILRESVLEIRLEPQGRNTEVTLTADQRLRGLSRLGSPMMRRGTSRMLDDALAGVERALGSTDDPDAPGRAVEDPPGR